MKNKYSLSVREITEMAIFTAIAIVLDTFVKIPLGATGGSLNFSLIPILILAFRQGPVKGFIAGGFIYGLVTSLIDGYGMNMYLFDYLIPFGACATIGIASPYVFRNFEKGKDEKVISFVFVASMVLLQGIIRLIFSSIDSVLFYGLTYVEGLAYNIIYIFPTTILNMVLLCLLVPVLIKISRRYKTQFIKEIKYTDLFAEKKDKEETGKVEE